MLRKEEIETAVKNGMVYHRKPTEPVLTRNLFELIKWAYCAGYRSGVNSMEMEEGFVQLLNDYFGKEQYPFGEADDNGQK